MFFFSTPESAAPGLTIQPLHPPTIKRNVVFTSTRLPNQLPVSSRGLARWQQLVTPQWLAALQAGKAVMAAPLTGWRLFEVGWDASESFFSSHIPGAGYIDTNLLEQGPLWNKVPDPMLLRLLLDNGIRHDTTVVLYARNTLAAARAAHLMLYGGVNDVRILDGGFAAWTDAGFPAATGLPHQYPGVADFGVDFPNHPEYLIDTRQAKSLLQQADGVLVSIRSWDEFIGNTSGYSYIKPRGDICSAHWGRAGGDVNSMHDYHHPDGTMRAADEICAFWNEAGISADQQAAFYCGTGWRASLAFFYAWLMGWERISVYDGGWYEWSMDPNNPTVRGERNPDAQQCKQALTLITSINQTVPQSRTVPGLKRCA
jgi:3-mercaptopyruvate sulfurtransferase SseA